jgi:hypothetical protein
LGSRSNSVGPGPRRAASSPGAEPAEQEWGGSPHRSPACTPGRRTRPPSPAGRRCRTSRVPSLLPEDPGSPLLPVAPRVLRGRGVLRGPVALPPPGPGPRTRSRSRSPQSSSQPSPCLHSQGKGRSSRGLPPPAPSAAAAPPAAALPGAVVAAAPAPEPLPPSPSPSPSPWGPSGRCSPGCRAEAAVVRSSEEADYGESIVLP